MKKILLFSLILSPWTLFSQNAQSPSKEYSNVIFTNFLSPLGIANPGIEIGYERSYSHFATQVRASYLTPESLWDQNRTMDQNGIGYRFGVQEKFFMSGTSESRFYVGLDFDYLRKDYTDNLNFRDLSLSDSAALSGSSGSYYAGTYQDTVRVHREVYAINSVFGYQETFDHLFFNIAIGLGARYKSVYHEGRLKAGDPLFSREIGMSKHLAREGQYWRLSVPVTVRIGWAF